MARRLIRFFLVLCIGWQALASAGAGVVFAEVQHLGHALLHFKGVAHHHDAHDEGVHLDDSVASAVHVVLDTGVFAPALMPAPTAALAAVPRVRPAISADRVRLRVIPDGLERPPRSLA